MLQMPVTHKRSGTFSLISKSLMALTKTEKNVSQSLRKKEILKEREKALLKEKEKGMKQREKKPKEKKLKERESTRSKMMPREKNM